MIMEPELFDGGKTIKKYNTIIVGSDQVWNLKITNDDHTYFLEGDRFSKINHKVAYAASFGDEGPSRVLESDLLLRLHEFSFVGLREKGAERALNEAGITNTHVVVDPTLLIETTDWENLADVQHVQKEPYLFAYIVSNFNETIGYAKRLANEMGLKLVVLHCAANRPIFGVSSVNDASPRQFLGLIKNAAFVVTSSFHGMCFSLLFHKQFRYLSNQEKTSTVSRMDSLAMALGVESASAQYVGKPAAFDYEEIEARLSSIRSDSVRYLSSALNE